MYLSEKNDTVMLVGLIYLFEGFEQELKMFQESNPGIQVDYVHFCEALLVYRIGNPFIVCLGLKVNLLL